MLPSLQRCFCLLKDNLWVPVASVASMHLRSRVLYPQLTGVCNVPVCLKQLTDVECLRPPNVPSNAPIEGELETATVEAPAKRVRVSPRLSQ